MTPMPPEQHMMSWSADAVAAWGTVFAAIGTVATSAFLTWDRFRPPPLRISARLDIREKTKVPDAVRCSVFLFSEIGEPLIVRTILAPAGMELASAHGLTPAAMAQLDPATLKWSPRLRYSRRIDEAHRGDEPLVDFFARRSSATAWPWRQALRVEGDFLFRARSRFSIAPVSTKKGSLRLAVTRKLIGKTG